MQVEKCPPNNYGCWFCSTKTKEMPFDMEFDTYYHECCIESALLKVIGSDGKYETEALMMDVHTDKLKNLQEQAKEVTRIAKRFHLEQLEEF